MFSITASFIHGLPIVFNDSRVGRQITDVLVMKSRTDKPDENLELEFVGNI